MEPSGAEPVPTDFAEYKWMGEEDLESFDKEWEQDEAIMSELEELIDEEELNSYVFFSQPSFDSSSDEDYAGYSEELEGELDDGWQPQQLNPDAPAFIPSMTI